MSLYDEMAVAHDRDYKEKRRLDDLIRAIDEFLKDPPSRCKTDTRDALGRARDDLRRESDHIVAVWN